MKYKDYLWIENLIQQNFPLKELSTYRVGGPAEYYIEPADEEQALAALKWADEKKIEVYILGGGSNVLIHDEGLKGLVINTKRLNKILSQGKKAQASKNSNKVIKKETSVAEEVTIFAQCGAQIDRIVDKCAELGYGGFEEFAGLPGTVGGAIFMNARAYGKSIADIIETVRVFKKNANGRWISKTYRRECLSFGYKSSPFQKERTFILEATFKLKPVNSGKIKNLIEEYRQKRKELGQYVLPNAGCVFKNNRNFGKPTGMIIEELGLKGKKIGGAEIFNKHANFIVNTGNATAQDIYNLIRFIENEVERRLGLKLEREIRLLGKWEE